MPKHPPPRILPTIPSSTFLPPPIPSHRDHILMTIGTVSTEVHASAELPPLRIPSNADHPQLAAFPQVRDVR